jgi:hypothetical protein
MLLTPPTPRFIFVYLVGNTKFDALTQGATFFKKWGDIIPHNCLKAQFYATISTKG